MASSIWSQQAREERRHACRFADAPNSYSQELFADPPDACQSTYWATIPASPGRRTPPRSTRRSKALRLSRTCSSCRRAVLIGSHFSSGTAETAT